jgi:hypothetical protein
MRLLLVQNLFKYFTKIYIYKNVYYQISFQPKEGAFYIWKLCWSLWKDIFSIFHQISGLRLWAVFRRRKVVMGIDVRWVSRGRRDVVSYHKWMTSHNFFDFGVTCSTFTTSLLPLDTHRTSIPITTFLLRKTAHKRNPEIWWYCLIHMHIG